LAEATKLDFEKALQELESLVERMEKGDLSLEESLAQFARGIELTRGCQQTLAEAEQKVQMLIEQDGRERIIPFDAEQ
jgi:exodeoxyribonuclease VII small subunit